MVETVIRIVDDKVAVKRIYATRSKYSRAEPIAALFEQGRCHMVGRWLALEDEMITYVPGSPSPNHLDAAVHALSELMLEYNHLIDAPAPMSLTQTSHWRM